MSNMQFISMRDFRTQTTQVWNKLQDGEEIVITNNGRPRAFLVNIPEGCFDEVLRGIRQTQAQVSPLIKSEKACKNEPPLNMQSTNEEKEAAMQEIRGLLAGIDGSNVDLDQMRAERRAAKYERLD